MEAAAWLVSKLVLHPLAVAGTCWLFGVTGYAAGVMIAAAASASGGQCLHPCAALPRCATTASTAILLSTAASVLTVTAVIALISQGGYT